ncbi:Os06g0492750 [Oryza sativa Japonica Group]|uniref:Os06g0492750 protein n=1 Tax=Oryza sativa subsp. japonica TaxID=39947 RepID=A0A0P0WWV5_ORYSJ|nr:hypothetical protein EE612_034286 [Oryza sativa]BAS97868.1 Os06g0492750 [Oryza sativa Japonica Group]
MYSEFTDDHLLDMLLKAIDWASLLQELGIEHARGLVDTIYLNVECLDVGKTSEEDRQHLDFIVVKKFHLNSQHPDAADHMKNAAAHTLMMVLPMFSSCIPGTKNPRKRRLGAWPILILVHMLMEQPSSSMTPPTPQISQNMSLSRRAACSTVISSTTDSHNSTQRRLWLATRRRTSSRWPTISRFSRTGHLSSSKARSRTPMTREQRPSSRRWGKAPARWMVATSGNLRKPM